MLLFPSEKEFRVAFPGIPVPALPPGNGFVCVSGVTRIDFIEFLIQTFLEITGSYGYVAF